MRKSNSLENIKTALVIPLNEAKEKVSIQIDKGNKLRFISIMNREHLEIVKSKHYYIWRDYTEELLRQIFNNDENANKFSVGLPIDGSLNSMTFKEEIDEFHKYLQDDIDCLMSICKRLELFPVLVTEHKCDSPNALAKIELIIHRFHIVARQLRHRHDNRTTLDIADEFDVQDLLHTMLKIYFDDIRPEEWTPSYAGSSSRVDFLLKNENIVIEAKKTRKGLGVKELGEQLIIDISKYQEHPNCKILICFIYDPEGIVGNPKGLITDLEKQSSNKLKVKVYINPT